MLKLNMKMVKNRNIDHRFVFTVYTTISVQFQFFMIFLKFYFRKITVNMDIMTMITMIEDTKSKANVLTSSFGGHMYYDWPWWDAEINANAHRSTHTHTYTKTNTYTHTHTEDIYFNSNKTIITIRDTGFPMQAEPFELLRIEFSTFLLNFVHMH